MSADLVDLTETRSRAERDRLADRTDVLDKVGVLRTDNMHVTTDMVAEFYEVPIETIRSTVNRNREELDDDGLKVLSRREFDESFNLQLSSRANSFMLYPRRAVLRIGMLLRDSAVARRVRDYLLDAERPANFVIPQTLPEALRLAADECEARMLAEARLGELRVQIEADRPLVERSRNRNNGQSKLNRQQFFRELKQWAHNAHHIEVKQEHVMAFLSTAKLGLFIRGERRDAGQATAWAIERGYAVNDEEQTRNGHDVLVGRLTAAGQDYAWDRCLRYIDANGTLELPRRISGGAA